MYKSSAPGRVPELKGMVLINESEIIVNTQSLPVQGLNSNYTVPVNDGYSVQEEITF